jgi:hypothetical protein
MRLNYAAKLKDKGEVRFSQGVTFIPVGNHKFHFSVGKFTEISVRDVGDALKFNRLE